MRRFDLRSLSFGRSDQAACRLPVELDPFVLGGERYAVPGDRVDLSLAASRVGTEARPAGSRSRPGSTAPAPAASRDVDLALEVSGAEYVADGESQGVEEGEEAYVRGYQLQADRWARDLLADALPGRQLPLPRGLPRPVPACAARTSNEAG